MDKEREKEILKETLLNYKRASEDTWREVNGCIFMQEVVYLSDDKKKALNKLKECTDLTGTILRLCDTALLELEKLNIDPAYVKPDLREIERLISQVKESIDDYNKTKPVEG